MLQKLKQQKSDGFTIIEVLIVLAIAGLILLIVFLAVPNLQRNSRNTQRKNDVQAILGAVGEYESNNAGALPATGTSGSSAPVLLSGSTLTLGASGSATSQANLGYYNSGTVTIEKFTTGISAPDTDTVLILEGAGCNGNTPVAASARSVAAYYHIENADQCTSS
jgi:prepilin-type N-terminal cleavage/methylation domain-containing protein